MKGFCNANFALESHHDRITGRDVFVPCSPKRENSRMEQAGFTIDRENGIYIREGYGAFRTNVNAKITSIDDLRNYYDELLEKNPYSEIVQLMDEEGYEFVLGPGAPAANGTVSGPGLYCKNYKEILEKQKATNKQDAR